MGRVIEAFAQFLDGAGDPLALGWLKFLESGSNNTLKNTYSDSALAVPNENPLQLDAEGRCPSVFGTGSYRVVSYTYDPLDEGNPGVQVQMFDPVEVAGSSSSGGGAGLEAWDNATTYGIGDIVKYNLAIYRSIVASNLNKNPAVETSSWEEIAFVQIYNANVSYAIGDFVEYLGAFYFSRTSPNLANTPGEDITNWHRVAGEILSVDEKTDDYEVLATDRGKLLVLGSGTAVDKTFSLPAMSAAMDGFIISMFNGSAYDLTIDTLDAATIFGQASVGISNGAFTELRYYHAETDWTIVSGNVGPMLGGQNIGMSSVPVKNIYIEDDAYVYFGDSQDAFTQYAAAGIFKLGTTGAEPIYFHTDGTDHWAIDASGHFTPLTANSYDIGTTALRIKDIYQGDDSAHYFGDAQDVTVYWDGADFEIIPSVDGTGNCKIGTNANSWADIYINAVTEIKFYTDATERWNINSTGDLVPSSAATYDIGSTSEEIEHIYQADNGFHYFGASQDAQIGYNGTEDVFLIQSTGAGGVYIDANNASGSIYLRTGALPTTRWEIDELGNLLPTSNPNIGSTSKEIGSVYIGSNEAIYFGDAQDANLYYNSSIMYIRPKSTTTYNLYIGSSTLDWDIVRVYAETADFNQVTYFRAVSIYNTSTSAGKAVYVDSSGLMGYDSSTREVKTNIKPIENIDWIFDVNPVSFNPKNDLSFNDFGMIAEELFEVNPDLTFQDNGKLKGIYYDRFIPFLIKVAQDQERRVLELEAMLNI